MPVEVYVFNRDEQSNHRPSRAMATTATFMETETVRPMMSEILRQRLRDLCNRTVAECFTDNGHWNWDNEFVGHLTAIFEIDGAIVQSEIGMSCIDCTVIVTVLKALGSGSQIPNSSSTSFVHMERHLRLLASALRLYKYKGRSLEHNLHDSLNSVIIKLDQMFKTTRTQYDGHKVERWNVEFFLQHCQHLLVSIDSTCLLAKRVATSFVLALDRSQAGGGTNQDDKRIGLALAERQRSRPNWHLQFVQLEDLSCAMLARLIRMHGLRGVMLDRLQEHEIETSELLCHCLEEPFEPTRIRPLGALKGVVGIAANALTQAVHGSKPHEVMAYHLQYGILDLMYQLLFRIRTWSRKVCFKHYVHGVRLALEKSHSSATHLHKKARDVWYGINEFGDKDNCVYGITEDRDLIGRWMGQSATTSDNKSYYKGYAPMQRYA
jgi:hypothetical protein